MTLALYRYLQFFLFFIFFFLSNPVDAVIIIYDKETFNGGGEKKNIFLGIIYATAE